MWLIAYGQFDSTDFWGMLGETFPLFMRLVVPPLLLYVVLTLAAEHIRPSVAALAIYLVVSLLYLPSMAVTGAWGPAHVAMDVGAWAWPMFGLALAAKTTAIYVCRWRARLTGTRTNVDR